MKEENKAKNAYALTIHTITYPTAVDRLNIIAKDIVYGIVAQEICPKTGKLHVQAYVYYKRPTRFHKILKTFGGCHIEPARKAPEANAVYCRKDLFYTERGNLELAQKLYFGEIITEASKPL